MAELLKKDNIKITVQEINKTQPLGAGDSSDVVYIPGFASFTNCIKESDYFENVAEPTEAEIQAYNAALQEHIEKYSNKPIFCDSVSAFEHYFGDTPYTLTGEDTNTDYQEILGNSYLENTPDRSYFYAKECLTAGLSIYYENILPSSTDTEGYIDIQNNINLKMVDDGTNESGVFVFNENTQELNVNAAESNEGTKFINFTFNLPNPLPGEVALVTSAEDSIPAVVRFVSADCGGHYFEVVDGKFAITGDVSDIQSADSTIPFTCSMSIEFAGDAAKTQDFRVGVNCSYITQEPEGYDRITYFYRVLGEHLEALEDKNEYTVKYITSGAYPTFCVPADRENLTAAEGVLLNTARKMLQVASGRNDAVALIDHNDDINRPLLYEKSVYDYAQEFFSNATNGSFGAMFTPWANYWTNQIVDTFGGSTTLAMPASYGYMVTLGYSIKTSPNWLAIAGVTRGGVYNIKDLRTTEVLSNVIAEHFQPKWGSEGNNVSLNAITNIRPYGLTLWGNRTLEPVHPRGTTALNFLNTRNMISDIKKVAYTAAKELMFEQDSDVLWLRFKSKVSPLLEQLKTGYGLSDYKIIKGTTKYDGSPLTRGEISAVIKIYPLYAVEYFEITVEINDNDVSVS